MTKAIPVSRALMHVVILLAVASIALTQERDRAKIPEKYKANLSEIYPSEEAWNQAKDQLTAKIPQLGKYQGKLMSSAATLADALDLMFTFEKESSRISTYAGLLADQDTRDGRHQAMRQEASRLRSVMRAQTAFIAPEILRGRKPAIEKFIEKEPRLKIYGFFLEETFRQSSHILSESEEKLLADLNPLSGSPSSVFAILSNADLPYPTVTLSDGKSVKIDQAAFTNYRALPNRSDREKVMSAFFQSIGTYSRTFGATINGEAQKLLFYAKARKYPSSLEMELDGPNIPVSVYSRLIDGVNRNLETFHRYLKLRKRMLGVDQLHYYDLYAPLVASVNLKYTPEEAQGKIVAALAPLGPEYTATLQRAFDERWIDLLPNDGKRSGAYMTGGAFDVHPYLLMSFNGQYLDVSTMAHELGHAMQTYMSNKKQPYPLAGYPIFVAEVASTFNESLLIDYMLKNVKDRDTRLALLGNYVENIKTTMFRQVQFAEFEMRLHEMAQKGEPIVGDTMDKLYMEITKKYYGNDAGVCIVDDYVAHEWSMVPHFYSDFYVYQYATSFIASEALASRVKSGDAAATKRYLEFLSAGGSKYPIELLKDAGVDMTSDEPLSLTIQSMNRAMDEMEKLLASR
jgi:oligoendopeptidase F